MSFFEFPNTRTYDKDLGWVISEVKRIQEIVDTFVYASTLKFADPILWNITTQYEKSTIVLDPSGNAYLSKDAVPSGIQLNNTDYWLEIFNFTDYTRTANQNLTVNVETNTTRATAAYQVDDWLIWNDILYKVTVAIAIDDTLIVAPAAGANIIHFTVEDFIKTFITYATGLINQYKDDIDASELAYRQQLAQDIATTTASLQAQLNAAIAGTTVDSEVINARVGAFGNTYNTLGEAIRDQIKYVWLATNSYKNCYIPINAPELQRNIYNNILFIYAYNVDLTNFKVTGALNTSTYPKTLILSDGSTNLNITMTGNVTTVRFRTGLLYIGYNWDNHTQTLNVTYANSKIEISNTISNSDNFANLQNIRDINSTIFDYTPDTTLTYTDIPNAYIDSSRKIVSTDNPQFHIRKYALSKNTDYVLFSDDYNIAAALPAVVFGNNDVTSGQIVNGFTVLEGSTRSDDYNIYFRNPADCYLYIACFEDKVLDVATTSAHKPKGSFINTYDLKVQAFGDSITDNSNNTWSGHITWLDYIRELIDSHYNISIRNSAYGGAALAIGSESVVNRVQSLLDTTRDIIFIWAGTNDWAGNQVPIGDMDSATNTIKGATKFIIEYLSQNTTAAIIFATPMQRYNDVDMLRPTNANGEPLNGLGLTLKDVCDAIQEVCDFYSIDCIRMDKILGINRLNIRDYASDGLHPSTELANKRIGSVIATEFNRMFFN